MLKQVVLQGRSEVHGANHNERHVCGRRRAGEPVSRQCLARTPLAACFSILLDAFGHAGESFLQQQSSRDEMFLTNRLLHSFNPG